MSELSVYQIVSGKWRENGYLLEAPSGAAVVVDPGMNLEGFMSLIEQRGCRPSAIINTHGHYDHVGSVAPLMEAFDIPFYLHKGDATLLRQANLYRALFDETETLRIPSPFTDLSELGETARIAHFDVEILATPGHTKGSVCLRFGDLLFTGDTLLGNGPGRVDLPGGSPASMAESQARLASLPDRLTVHPGHGKIVTLGDVRRRMEAG